MSDTSPLAYISPEIPDFFNIPGLNDARISKHAWDRLFLLLQDAVDLSNEHFSDTTILANQGTTATTFAAGDAPGQVARSSLGMATPLVASQPTASLVTRNPNNPIWTKSQSAMGSLYWPCPVKVGNTWRTYLSTDHNFGQGDDNGAVELITSTSSVGGPYTSQGVIYTDALEESIETPWVVYNEQDPDGLPWYMFHQRYNRHTVPNGQATCLVRSADGITDWEDPIYGDAAVLDVPASFWSNTGQAHTGYARVFRFGNRWFAFSLATGLGQSAIWRSVNGRDWTPDPFFPPFPGPNAHSSILHWQGEYWVVLMQAGARIIMAPIAPPHEDFRGLLGPPTVILELEGSEINPLNDMALRSMTAVANGDRVDLLYTAGSTNVNGNNGDLYHAWIDAEVLLG